MNVFFFTFLLPTNLLFRHEKPTFATKQPKKKKMSGKTPASSHRFNTIDASFSSQLAKVVAGAAESDQINLAFFEDFERTIQRQKEKEGPTVCWKSRTNGETIEAALKLKLGVESDPWHSLYGLTIVVPAEPTSLNDFVAKVQKTDFSADKLMKETCFNNIVEQLEGMNLVRTKTNKKSKEGAQTYRVMYDALSGMWSTQFFNNAMASLSKEVMDKFLEEQKRKWCGLYVRQLADMKRYITTYKNTHPEVILGAKREAEQLRDAEQKEQHVNIDAEAFPLKTGSNTLTLATGERFSIILNETAKQALLKRYWKVKAQKKRPRDDASSSTEEGPVRKVTKAGDIDMLKSSKESYDQLAQEEQQLLRKLSEIREMKAHWVKICEGHARLLVQ